MKKINLSDFSIALIVGISVTVLYMFANLPFSGPTYLLDEIGYLLNAAALSGSKVDGASSYHFGYSLFLIPSFIFFDRADLIWRAVQFTNSLLYGFSFLTLYVLTKHLVPNTSQITRFTAVVICSLGPPWLVNSGYAFPSPAFTLIFILSLWLLIRSDKDRAIYLYFHGFLVGFLYWIHPTGLAVAIASFLTLLYLGSLTKNLKVATLSILSIATTILLYHFLQSILRGWMTPEGFPANLHYPLIDSERITVSVLWSAFIRAIGQITYITIGTLGFGLAGIWAVLRMALTSSTNLSSRISGLFLLLSLLGIICMGSLMFSVMDVNRTDHWMYGRYSEGVLLPILLIGLITLKTRTLALPALLIPGTFLLACAITQEVFSIYRSDPGWNINLVNVSFFWVTALPSSYGFAFALMIGAGVTAFTLQLPKALARIALVIVFFLAINQGFSWHSESLANYSRPSSIPEIIKNNWSPGTCVGLDPIIFESHSFERTALYKFHLYNYEIRRMNIYDWASNCNGPYITSDFDSVDQLENVILAREIDTGLLLLSKKKENIIEPIFGIYPQGHICTFNYGCLSKSSQDLKHMSQVGELEGGILRSNGAQGFLFFGPYVDMPRGRYKITLDAKFLQPHESYIDIVTGPKASVKVASVNLIDLKQDNFEFSLHDNASELEVRLFASEKAQISFRGYQLVGPLPTSSNQNSIEYPILFSPNFTFSSDILRMGWHDIESSFVWSKKKAKLSLPIPKDCRTKLCEAKLIFNVFGVNPLKPGIVYFNSAEQGWDWSKEINVTSETTVELNIPLSGEKQFRRINIEIPKATSPKRLNGSTDKRTLGISLQRIELIKP
jgi:hypothetical protein